MGVYESLTNTVRSRYKTQVEDALSLVSIHDNQRLTTPEPGTQKWASVRILHTETEQIQAQGANRVYRKRGVLQVRLFAALRDGTGFAHEVVDTIRPAFRRQIVSGVVYQDPSMQRVGRVKVLGKGGWYRIDVNCPFYADDSAVVDAAVTPSARPTMDVLHETIQRRFARLVAEPESLTVVYDNTGHIGGGSAAIVAQPQPGSEWVQFSVTTVGAAGAEAGTSGTLRTPGIAFAQVFEPVNDGDGNALALADKIASRFRSVVEKGVSFRTPALFSVGRSGPWWQLNVQLPFDADEAA